MFIDLMLDRECLWYVCVCDASVYVVNMYACVCRCAVSPICRHGNVIVPSYFPQLSCLAGSERWVELLLPVSQVTGLGHP